MDSNERCELRPKLLLFPAVRYRLLLPSLEELVVEDVELVDEEQEEGSLWRVFRRDHEERHQKSCEAWRVQGQQKKELCEIGCIHTLLKGARLCVC